MKPNFIIRLETTDDVGSISLVTRAAFEHHPFSQQHEEFIILALRNAGALSLSLVAENDAKIIGHIAFSPITISDGTGSWYGLGPVSVLPEFQRSGVGSALILEGLARLRATGMLGCALVGDPEYYRRFGFATVDGLVYPGIPPQYFMALKTGPQMPQGTVTFHQAFQAKS